jgi:uncharacterized membrane protein YkvA (DUF1232 family)
VTILEQFRARVHRLRDETGALYLAARHPETPWYAKLFAVVVVAYAISPIDLIPDFIPVLGYLDDLVLVPLGIVVAIRMIPPHVLADCRARSRAANPGAGSTGRIAAVAIACIWLVAAALCARWVYAEWAVDR